MDVSPAAVHNNRANRRALLMALVGVGLLGYVVAGWMDAGSSLSTNSPGYAAEPVDRVAVMPTGGAAAAAMAVGFTLLIAASVVMLRSRQDLVRSTLRDPLTGLYTGLYAAEALPGLAARDDRAGHSRLVLVRVEIDAIDRVRRRYGGAAVDLVLGSVGRHIRSQTREDDLPVAPDADGFAIYLHCEELEQARAFCRRLATLLRSEQLDWNGDVIKVSANMQLAARKVGESIESLQQRTLEGVGPTNSHQGRQVEA